MMSFNKGDIIRGNKTKELVVIREIIIDSMRIQYMNRGVYAGVRDNPCNQYINANFTLVKAGRPGQDNSGTS